MAMRRPHVLVVDPNPATLQRVRAALEGSIYQVLSARDAVEAHDRSASHEIAVVLSSTGLPRGNGYDLARAMLNDHPAAKVFLLSGGFEVYNQQRADQCGVVGRISKPFSVDGLRTRLEGVLGPLLHDLEDDTAEELPALDGSVMEPLLPTDEFIPSTGEDTLGYSPPISQERIATIIPRDYEQLGAPGAATEPLNPAVEQAVLEVLPEVVEAVWRRALQSSAAFRELVEVAVDEAVRAHLPAMARRIIRERIAEIEGGDGDEAV